MAKSSQSRASRSARPTGDGIVGGTENGAARTSVVWAPPLSGEDAQGPAPEAIAAFERAMTALQRHDYRTALETFTRLIEEFPAERALLDRARVYATLCERELQRPAARRPQTLEERLTAATAALNNEQNELAEQLLVQIVEEAPQHELGHYLMAVLQARRGDFSDAVESLRRAAAITPEVLAQARHDEDFENLRGLDLFEQLLAEVPAGRPPEGREASSGR
jgi:Tfp pilus assembly protein PilF